MPFRPKARLVWLGLIGLSLTSCGSAPTFEEGLPQEPTQNAPSPPLLTENLDAPSPTQPGCTTQQLPATLRPGPVDIVLVVDNSLSMIEEVRAIEENINANFADILAASGSDYRVILLTEHRTTEGSGSGQDATSVCITQPLSTLEQCPAERPGTSERFFHYDLPIESTDSLQRIVQSLHRQDATYATTQVGWSQWLRPDSKKVFLEVTDDDTAMAPESFIAELTRLAPEHFGADELNPQFVFHSIVGLREKAEASSAYLPDEPRTALRCRSDSAQVRNPGLGYQLLSRLTSGLRFPICRADLFDTVFQHISENVLQSSGVACSIDIPPPPVNRQLILDNIELVYQSTAASEPLTLRRARQPEDCGVDAFQVIGDRVELCSDACDAFNANPTSAQLAVRYTCSPSYIVR